MRTLLATALAVVLPLYALGSPAALSLRPAFAAPTLVGFHETVDETLLGADRTARLALEDARRSVKRAHPLHGAAAIAGSVL